MSLLRSYQKVVGLKSDRMKVGVRKLEETNNVVDSLKQELVKLEPILKQKAIETETLLAQVCFSNLFFDLFINPLLVKLGCS